MLAALDLDYARSNLRIGGTAGVLLLLLGVVVLSGTLFYQWNLSHEMSRVEQEVARAEGQIKTRAGLTAAVRAGRDTAAEIKHARVVIQKITLPWDRLFHAIEASDTKGVGLLSIQPDAEKGQVAVGGEAKTFDAMFSYLRRLEGSGALTQVHLTHHEVQQQDPQRSVRFTLAARWAVAP